MKSISKSWRDSSTLLLCKHAGHPGTGNLEVLVQTRPERASTFANSVVFPGGVAEVADAAPRWIDLIKSFGYTQKHFNALHQAGPNVTTIFQNNPVQRHISLRITAIRETFEELGVIVCSKEKESQRTTKWASCNTNFNVKDWQTKVSKDPEQLFNLCEELGCYPDVWSLHFWSNWLTPAHFEKRFNTAFFIAALQDIPGVQENSEVFSSKWTSPADILKQYKQQEVVLFPPQVYEFIRLQQFSGLDEVIEHAASTSPLRNVLFYPVLVQATNGMVHLLPGDDLYPTIVDYSADVLNCKDKTIHELREGCESLNRLEIQGKPTLLIKNLNLRNHITMNDKTIEYSQKQDH